MALAEHAGDDRDLRGDERLHTKKAEKKHEKVAEKKHIARMASCANGCKH